MARPPQGSSDETAQATSIRWDPNFGETDSRSRQRSIQLFGFLRAQSERRGTNQLINLLRVSRADDRGRDRGMAQRPGDGYFARRTAVLLGNHPQAVDKRERLAQQRLLIKTIVPSPIPFGE